jgi:hypothetical protein
MPFVIGVGVLELLLLIAVVRDGIYDVRRKIIAAPQDYAHRVFWLVAISFSLLLVGFICLMVGGVLILNAEGHVGRAFLILGLCLSFLGYMGEMWWSVIRRRVKRSQQARKELQVVRQTFLNAIQARTLNLINTE